MDVPEDIWSLIATYLTSGDLGALLTLNRAFLYAALNARYRHVTLRSKGRRELSDFTRIQDPFIASRVRSLYLMPTCLLPDPSDPPPGIATKFIKVAKKVIWANDPRVTGFGTPRKVTRKIDSIFANLNCLDEFGLFCRDPRDLSPAAHTIVNSAWSRLRNIQTLSLDMPLLALGQAVPASLIFPRLEALTLRMHLTPSYYTDALQIISSVSLPFVTNHRQTLRHFNYDLRVNGFDFSPFFRNLGYFPHLKGVETSVILNNAAPGLWHFLGLHSTRLETLGLAHHQSVEPLSYDGPALSALNVLNLDLPAHTTNFMASLLPGSSPKVLRLHSVVYRHYEVPQILDVCAGHRLRSLVIKLDLLSPQVLDYMSENLPNLHALSLQIGGYTAPGDGEWNLGAQFGFFEAMENKDYSHWQPPIFDLKVCTYALAGCDTVLKRLFPQIKLEHISLERRNWGSFCGGCV